MHVDKSFLAEEMPEVVDWLHYRYGFVSLAFDVNFTNSAICSIVGMFN